MAATQESQVVLSPVLPETSIATAVVSTTISVAVDPELDVTSTVGEAI